MSSGVDFSIVVPVYNSTGSLEMLGQRIGAVFSGSLKSDYEIIFVDDASPNPLTWPALVRLAATNPHVKAIRLKRNSGQQAATLCGLAESLGRYVVTIDDDLQHRPEDIPLLAARSGHDIVIGQYSGTGRSRLRRLAGGLKSRFDRIFFGVPPSISLTPFRLINRSVIDRLLQINSPFPFVPALLFQVSKDAVGVQVSHDFRSDGISGYTPVKLVRVLACLIFNYLSAGASGKYIIPLLRLVRPGPAFEIDVVETKCDNARLHHRDGTIRNDVTG